MQQITMDTDALKLPHELAEKIGTEQVIIREVSEGLLIIPVTRPYRKLRGMLKGTGFSTESFFKQKQADKELEA